MLYIYPPPQAAEVEVHPSLNAPVVSQRTLERSIIAQQYSLVRLLVEMSLLPSSVVSTSDPAQGGGGGGGGHSHRNEVCFSLNYKFPLRCSPRTAQLPRAEAPAYQVPP